MLAHDMCLCRYLGTAASKARMKLTATRFVVGSNNLKQKVQQALYLFNYTVRNNFYRLK